MSKDRVFRGGSFSIDSRCLRSSLRVGYEPENRSRNIGFRIVVRRKP